MEVLANRSLYKKGRMGAVGFEPTPPKRLVPKTSALDHSATLPCIPFFASKNKLISPFWHKNARPSNKNLIITGYRMQSLVQAGIVSRQLQREQNILRSMEKRSCMALVTTTFFATVLPFSCFSGFSGEILFFHCNHVPTIVHNKRKIPFISCLLSSRAENIYLAPQKNGIKR